MNSIIIIGNLTNDPEHRTTASGKEVTTFTVAVNRRGKDAKDADFFRVSVWGEMGNTCAKYLAKGRKVGVSGSVSVSAYKDRNGEARANLEVFAQSVEFLSPKAEEPKPAPKAEPEYLDVKDGELPF